MRSSTPPARSGYLPPHLAAVLRENFAKLGIAERAARHVLTDLMEAAYSEGAAEAYARGYSDGDDDREAEMTAGPVVQHERVQLDMHRSTATVAAPARDPWALDAPAADGS